MNRIAIDKQTERRLYAESMGRCMNPSCCKKLLYKNGDVIEKAHIDSYSKSKDNSFENLIVLCPTCHTNLDKNQAFDKKTLHQWKKIRKNELDNFFRKKFDTFKELNDALYPYLSENLNIYQNYYLKNNKTMWDIFLKKIITNNQIIKALISNNIDLVQSNENECYSNKSIINKYLLHIDEFEKSTLDNKFERNVLYPQEVNSIFGLEPLESDLIPSVESLEAFLKKLSTEGKSCKTILGNDNPSIEITNNEEKTTIYLKDQPRLRQLYFNYDSFRRTDVRLDSLNYILKYLNNNNINFKFKEENKIREIIINNKPILFVYEYCLSKAFLYELAPKEQLNIVNLHNWNGKSCISDEARQFSKIINVNLYTTEEFYRIARRL